MHVKKNMRIDQNGPLKNLHNLFKHFMHCSVRNKKKNLCNCHLTCKIKLTHKNVTLQYVLEIAVLNFKWLTTTPCTSSVCVF